MDHWTCEDCGTEVTITDYNDESGFYCQDCNDAYVFTMCSNAAKQIASGVLYMDDYRQTDIYADLPY